MDRLHLPCFRGPVATGFGLDADQAGLGEWLRFSSDAGNLPNAKAGAIRSTGEHGRVERWSLVSQR